MKRQKGQIKSNNEYYPYGLLWSNPALQNNETYQGKEFQCNEWQGDGLELYDFGARLYDPTIGRWHCTDPMDQFSSPYLAMGNNPVVNIDPDGMWVPWGGIFRLLDGITWQTHTTTTWYSYIFHDYTMASMSEVEVVAHTSTQSESHSLSDLGSIASMLFTAASVVEDGKAITDAAGVMGKNLSTQLSSPLQTQPPQSQKEFDIRYSSDYANHFRDQGILDYTQNLLVPDLEIKTRDEIISAIFNLSENSNYFLNDGSGNLFRLHSYDIYAIDPVKDPITPVPNSASSGYLLNEATDDPVFDAPNRFNNRTFDFPIDSSNSLANPAAGPKWVIKLRFQFVPLG